MSTESAGVGRWGTLSLMIMSAAFTTFGIWMGTQLGPAPDSNPLPIHADTASRGENLSMATGFIDDGTEGLFVLDHQTGLLQCWVLNNQTGSIAAIYRANVAVDLKIDKVGDADFVMSTGLINFEGARGNFRPAGSLCYVGDGNSGRVVGYGIQFNRAAFNANQEQGGEMSIVCTGIVREGTRLRDQ